jgi:hypothetical protein
MASSPQTLYASGSVSAGTSYSATTPPCDMERSVALYVSATAGSGTVTITLQTSLDGTTWFDTISTSALASGGSAVLSLTADEGLGRYYRAKAVVASASTTFSVIAVSR